MTEKEIYRVRFPISGASGIQGHLYRRKVQSKTLERRLIFKYGGIGVVIPHDNASPLIPDIDVGKCYHSDSLLVVSLADVLTRSLLLLFCSSLE